MGIRIRSPEMCGVAVPTPGEREFVPKRGGRAVDGEAVFPPVPPCACPPIGNEGTDPLEAQQEPLCGEVLDDVPYEGLDVAGAGVDKVGEERVYDA